MDINYKKLLGELTQIGISLSAERDINKLLDIILEESMNITSSDGGSIYINEGNSLQFALAKNRSREIDFKEFHLALNKKSIAGYVGLTGETLNIINVNKIPEHLGLSYNSSFDKTINYKTVNILTIPMKDFNSNIVGVVQLINKKKSNDFILGNPLEIEDKIKDYKMAEIEIITSLASQAGILIERTILYNEIKELLRSFIESLVMTLETRDTTTSGHSRRLAGYAMRFLEAVSKVKYGKYEDFTFSIEEIREIYYAALLHDIGKIGVKESILQKKDRLTEEKIEGIKYRYKYIKTALELKQLKSKLDEKEKVILNTIDGCLDFILSINKKGFIDDETEKQLKNIKKIKINLNNEKIELLTDFEYDNLSIKRGNLTKTERKEIESHVIHTYTILKGIKWTKALLKVPIIAGSHHERWNGKGYPKGLKGDEIPLQARILAILDIFEALTARDRPYKKPMSVEKAIEILKFEVNDEHLDKDLFEIFMNEKIFELYKEELNKIFKI